MNGPQMSLGYWKDRERTDAAFVVPFGENDIFYRTGDRFADPRIMARSPISAARTSR